MPRAIRALTLAIALTHACGEPTESGPNSAAGSGGSCDMTAVDPCPACESPQTCDAATYTDNLDGTVASSCCNLEWQQSTSPSTLTWTAAQDYCASLELVGGGWRLPTRAELESLVDETMDPTIDVARFPDTPPQTYWSATPYCCAPNGVWIVVFNYGLSSGTVATGTYHARCVRTAAR